MVKVRIDNRLTTIRVKFAFEEYISLILNALPQSDLVGIKEISIVETFSDSKLDEDTLACYRHGRNTRDATIEIHLPRFRDSRCQSFTFRFYPEIAAYRLSATVCHEVGHHAHRALRHGVTRLQKEPFAKAYARAGAFSYLRLRSAQILSSHKRASYNIWLYGIRGWRYWRNIYRKLTEWLDKNKNGIPFP
jgi:hypothetical protein